MKRITVLVLIVMLMAGCTPSELFGMISNTEDTPQGETSNTESSVTEAASSEPVSSESGEENAPPGEPDSTELNDTDSSLSVPDKTEPNDTDTSLIVPDNTEPNDTDTVQLEPVNTDMHFDAKDYYELVTDLGNEIERAMLESAQGTASGYPFGITDAFYGMLQYRQSLEDVNEEMGYFYRNQYEGCWVSINVIEEYSDGNMNYRIILFSAMLLPMERMYIQIYNDEYFEARYVYDYDREGGSYEFVKYCGFIQASNKNYLVIIEKEYHDASQTINYYLVNYEVDGKDLRKYLALKKEFSNEKWTVNETYMTSLGKDYKAKISYMHRLSWEERREQNLDSSMSFIDNILTITSDNDRKDEISLLFEDGFWEVISVKSVISYSYV